MSQPLPVSTTEHEFIGLVKMGLLERQGPSGWWSRLRYHRTCIACRKYFSGRSDFLQCRLCVGSDDDSGWQFDSTVANRHIRLLGGDTSANQQEMET